MTHSVPNSEGDQSDEQWCVKENQYTGIFINHNYVLFKMTASKKSERAFLREFRILYA